MRGAGLGLALAREVAEAHGARRTAHGGRIVLANRDGGWLSVAMILPAGV